MHMRVKKNYNKTENQLENILREVQSENKILIELVCSLSSENLKLVEIIERLEREKSPKLSH